MSFVAARTASVPSSMQSQRCTANVNKSVAPANRT
jgi:hypothetical protein